jgi:hypothetical protein
VITLDACSWDNPGQSPFTGSVPATVYAYAEIPKEARDRLYARMQRHAFDDLAQITADTIVGQHEYTDLRAMHFGGGKLCKTVSRAKWGARREIGLVYCDGIYCLIVPTVCRNVSLVTRVVPLAPPPAPEPVLPGVPAVPDTPPGEPGVATGVPIEPGVPDLPGTPVAQPYGPHGWPGTPYNQGHYWPAPPVTPVPEPATWLLLLVGVAALVARGGRYA